MDEQLRRIDVRQITKFEKLPQMPALQLKRFDYDIKECQRVEITDPFVFPDSFDASEFFEGHVTQYKLRGVVMHAGVAEGGHYSCLVHCNGKWCSFNDGLTATLTDAVFKSTIEGSKESTQCAYLLFCERVDPIASTISCQEKPISEQVRELLTAEELSRIEEENSEFLLIQRLFAPATA
jgi:ubiquitin C-terminal hydrolase